MDTVWIALRVALSLGVVLALLWTLQRKLSKGSLGKRLGVRQHGRRAASVSVVGRQGIGGKASVVVVDVEGERLVLGVTEHQVTMLTSGEAPAPALELVTGPIMLPTRGAEGAAESDPAPADAFGAELARQSEPARHSAPGRRAERAERTEPTPLLQPVPAPVAEAEALPMRPRNRARRAAAPAAQQLQGSILSADTWRQAAAAVRSRRTG